MIIFWDKYFKRNYNEKISSKSIKNLIQKIEDVKQKGKPVRVNMSLRIWCYITIGDISFRATVLDEKEIEEKIDDTERPSKESKDNFHEGGYTLGGVASP
jgi:HKD family nuclease